MRKVANIHPFVSSEVEKPISVLRQCFSTALETNGGGW